MAHQFHNNDVDDDNNTNCSTTNISLPFQIDEFIVVSVLLKSAQIFKCMFVNGSSFHHHYVVFGQFIAVSLWLKSAQILMSMFVNRSSFHHHYVVFGQFIAVPLWLKSASILKSMFVNSSSFHHHYVVFGQFIAVSLWVKSAQILKSMFVNRSSCHHHHAVHNELWGLLSQMKNLQGQFLPITELIRPLHLGFFSNFCTSIFSRGRRVLSRSQAVAAKFKMKPKLYSTS